MDELREIDIRRFPLTNLNDVVGLFEDQTKNDVEPNLTLLSIVLGIVEHLLTIKKPLDKRLRGRPSERLALQNIDQADKCDNNANDDDDDDDERIPTVELADVNVLFELFVKLIKDNVDLSLFEHSKYTSTGLLKKVSDVLWTTLTRTFYKDKGHLQFLNTLFSEQKMDCFGMAFGVISGCQVLGLKDVHMAVTEDHVWAIHGKNGCLTSEITWHGKGTEDRRGNPVTMTAPENSWLYERPMICNRYEEVAVLVVSINTVIHATLESYQLAAMQKKILWNMYDLGHLKKYPIALSTLADLEEIQPSSYGGDNKINSNNIIDDSNNNKINNINDNNVNNNNVNKGKDSEKNGTVNGASITSSMKTLSFTTISNNNSINNNDIVNNNNIAINNNNIRSAKKQKRPSSLQLYRQAINISRTLYEDSKIYPHTYLGNYQYRRRKYKEALRSWADAAQVASNFNYNREDDEMYREFHEIANDIMPNIIRTCCAVIEVVNPTNPATTPVPSSQRSHQKKGKKKSKSTACKSTESNTNSINTASSNGIDGGTDTASTVNVGTTDNVNDTGDNDTQLTIKRNVDTMDTDGKDTSCNKNNNKTSADHQQSSTFINDCNNNSSTTTTATTLLQQQTSTKTKPSPSLLLSDSDCYADVLRFFDGICKWEEGSTMPVLHIIWANNMAYIVSKFLPIARTNLKIFVKLKDLENDVNSESNKNQDNNPTDVEKVGNTSQQSCSTVLQQKVKRSTKLLLRSHKMASMKDLLTTEKLNTSAIKLLLTAQLQVSSKSSSSLNSGNSANNRHGNSDVNQPPRKRTRFNEHAKE